MNKHIINLWIGAAIVAGLLFTAGCNRGANIESGREDFEFSSYPMSTDVTLEYWCGLNNNVAALVEDMGKTKYARELMRQSGVNIKYVHPPMGQEADQLNLMLASGALPDIIEYNWYSFPGGPTKALEEGFILGLNDIIEQSSPNFRKYLDEHPDVDKMVMTDDKSYYAYPFIRGDEILLISEGLIVRQDWLDRCGLAMPETIDEWHDVLTQFKNKLGAKAPLSYVFPNIFKTGEIIGAYGITKEFTVEDGRVVFGPYDPRFRSFLETLQAWYAQGLIDPNIANVDKKTLDANMINGLTGATYGFAGSGLGNWMASLAGTDPSANLVPAPHLSMKKGERPRIGQRGFAYALNSAAITTECKNVGIAARLLDFGYGKEGYMLNNFGIEGESYNMVDGYPAYSDLIMKNPEGLSLTSAMVQYTRCNYFGPFVQAKEYVEQYYRLPQQKAALTVWRDTDVQKYQLPPITFTPEESAEVSNIMNNITTFVDEKMVRYTMGLESLDQYGAFVSALKGFGAERMLEIYQHAYERYINR